MSLRSADAGYGVAIQSTAAIASGRSIPLVVSGLYEKLSKLRDLYGCESVEEILDDIITWRERFNRLVELQTKELLTVCEYQEMQAIQREFRQDFEKQKARRRLVL